MSLGMETYRRYRDDHMPNKAPHPCASPSCPNTTHARYCEHHAHLSRQPDTRPSAAERGYNYAHQELRKQVLIEEPYCRHCGGASTDMDHIDGNSTNRERSNLQGLCGTCHKRKTVKENGGFGLKRFRIRG